MVAPTVATLSPLTGARAQTSPAIERIDLTKEGEVQTVKYVLNQNETGNIVTKLLKDKYLYVYFADPSNDNALTLKQVDSAQSSFAGAPGTTNSNVSCSGGERRMGSYLRRRE